MFTAKVKRLIEVKASENSATSQSKFVQAGLKKTAQTLSGNGALKYNTTGNPFVDQFGLMGSYKAPRAFEAIEKDTSTLAAIDLRLTVMFILFLRTITRVVNLFTLGFTSVPQRGAGLKHEPIMRMIWLHIYHPEVFWKNIHLFISVGSWKDIITMLSYDLQFNGWKDRKLNWDEFGKLILAGIESPNHVHLVKKYLPQIKANSRCKTLEAQADNIIAKWIASLLFGSKENEANTYMKYRKLKTSGKAHTWQQLISQQKHHLIDFNTVHGRALAQMVSGKYLKNNNLEKRYSEWLDKQPVVKFTGFPFELFKVIPQELHKINTINKQFIGLVETAKKGVDTNTSLIVVRDTSGSMGVLARGADVSAGNIAKGLALFFSYMLKGAFENTWIEFSDTAKMHQWHGSTPVEKWKNDGSSYIGSTNFQSVIDLFVKIKGQGVPEEEFPSGILCISDGEFNASSLNKTNVESARAKLSNAGFSKEYAENFKIILWNIQSHAYRGTAGNKFETYGNVPNVFYFSGYEPSIVSFLMGKPSKEGQSVSTPKSAEELFLAAMDQEVLNMVQV